MLATSRMLRPTVPLLLTLLEQVFRQSNKDIVVHALYDCKSLRPGVL